MTNLAMKLKWLKGDPFHGFKMTRKRVDKDFLTKWEVMLCIARLVQRIAGVPI